MFLYVNMGGGGSKQTTILKEIDAQLDAQFTANCNASAQSIQKITLKGLNLIIRDGCRISFMNKASVNSSCNIGPIIDAISEMVVSTDQEFAKGLQDAQDRQANQKCEADNCEDKLKIAVTKKLTSDCASEAKAQQTVELIGSTIFCDGNSVAEYGNASEVRATCLRSLLHTAVEEAVSERTGTPAGGPSQSLDSDMMIMGIMALVVVIVLIKK